QDGKVTFYWKVSSEADYDCFKFYIDDVEQDKISGEVDWEYKTYDLSAGEHTLRWAYEKDGSASESSDAGWVDDITITQNKEEVPSNDTVVETGDYIGVKYTGRLEDGSIFDSNEDSGELLYFTVGSGEMIEGFDEAVIGLLLGEKITVTIPPEKAYGLEGEHELAGKTLIFDIEIVEIGSQQSDTEEEVLYSYNFDGGSIFDSNEDSGELLYFTVGLGEMIEGFDEAVVGGVLGQKITVTIPPEKAYGLEGDHPLAGKTLIFDIQVMEINSRQSLIVGEIPYSCYFDDGISPAENDFTVGTTAEGNVLLEEDIKYGGYSVKIWGNDSHSGVTYMEKAFLLEQDSEVNFYWKVSSEEDYDYLKFYIDDVEQDKISGEAADWAYKTYYLSQGEHALKWTYEKDSNVSNGSDGGWVDDIKVSKYEAQDDIDWDEIFKNLENSSENGDTNDDSLFDLSELYDSLFSSSSSKTWVPSSFDEVVMAVPLQKRTRAFIPQELQLKSDDNLYAADTSTGSVEKTKTKQTAVSYKYAFDDGTSPGKNGFAAGGSGGGAVYVDSRTAYNDKGYSMKLDGKDTQKSVTYAEKVVSLKKAGEVSFLWKVSSEAGQDYLKFYVDGIKQDEISGEKDWHDKKYNLSEGEHTLKWEYSKNTDISNAEDAGWIDEIVIKTVKDSSAAVKKKGGGNVKNGGNAKK
ncbi:MAG: FKBP-type peptidyl-prolyl cis-trans isomerase, partial [Candidatus Omnitrophota bacterium]